eukprot:3332387-Pyramimonas_sp.AAC.1
MGDELIKKGKRVVFLCPTKLLVMQVRTLTAREDPLAELRLFLAYVGDSLMCARTLPAFQIHGRTLLCLFLQSGFVANSIPSVTPSYRTRQP